MNIKRGEIYLCALDPIVGKEIAKTRPAIIISNNTGNKFSGTVTIIPITSRNIDKIYPFEIFIEKGNGNLQKNSKAKTDQIRTIDKSRCISLIGELKRNYLEKLEKALKIHLSLNK
ncbi:MAG: type II toxin-antitoxin system PemK/MazF family toxin [Spirochaetia bacterium]|nr:type II toxin-antitoxin system PemK/MazF family toxin [Spirochaetia bacterium]